MKMSNGNGSKRASMCRLTNCVDSSCSCASVGYCLSSCFTYITRKMHGSIRSLQSENNRQQAICQAWARHRFFFLSLALLPSQLFTCRALLNVFNSSYEACTHISQNLFENQFFSYSKNKIFLRDGLCLWSWQNYCS